MLHAAETLGQRNWRDQVEFLTITEVLTVALTPYSFVGGYWLVILASCKDSGHSDPQEGERRRDLIWTNRNHEQENGYFQDHPDDRCSVFLQYTQIYLIWCHNPEHHNLQSHHYQNLKSYEWNILFYAEARQFYTCEQIKVRLSQI
jgi:hypothetical protein